MHHSKRDVDISSSFIFNHWLKRSRLEWKTPGAPPDAVLGIILSNLEPWEQQTNRHGVAQLQRHPWHCCFWLFACSDTRCSNNSWAITSGSPPSSEKQQYTFDTTVIRIESKHSSKSTNNAQRALHGFDTTQLDIFVCPCWQDLLLEAVKTSAFEYLHEVDRNQLWTAQCRLKNYPLANHPLI